jgi:hypothetical protein
MSQDHPISQVLSSHVEVRELLPLRGLWQLAPRSLRNGLVQATEILSGLLSTTVNPTPPFSFCYSLTGPVIEYMARCPGSKQSTLTITSNVLTLPS